MSSFDDNDTNKKDGDASGSFQPDESEITRFMPARKVSESAKADDDLRRKAEEKRRELAKQKAQQLEKRLALIAEKKAKASVQGASSEPSKSTEKAKSTETHTANKPSSETNEPLPSFEANQQADKTRIKPLERPSLDDATQFKPRAGQSDATQFKPKSNQGDATQFKPKSNQGDATQFKPRSNQGDATQFKPVAPRAPSGDGNADNSSDSTQFQPRGNRALEDDIDADKFVEPSSEKTVIGSNYDQTVINTEDDMPVANLAGTDMLKGRFVLEEVLGAGGMGVVYKARDLLKEEAQDREPYVAIKVLSNEFKSHPDAFIALQRESRRTQRIAHPNIVNVHDFDRDGDQVFMTMEFLDGKPLDKLISQYKATGLPEADAWQVLEGISAALIYAHGQKIIHSDFKPGNIFVTKTGAAKVFDFGIARAVAKAEQYEDSEDDKTVFDAGNLGALTPAYASYEMLEGIAPDIRDDIYALGCIAYEMFTGKHPYNRVHANEAYKQKMKPKRIANLSKRQWRAIEKSIAFKREDRIASVEDFWSELTSTGGSAKLVVGFGVFMALTVGILGYQFTQQPNEISINEDEVRSEIERGYLIEQNQKTVIQLLESPTFTGDWEERLFSAVEELRKLMGPEDVWLSEQEANAYQAYVAKVNELIKEESFERAKGLHKNAYRYSKDNAELDSLTSAIALAEEAYAKRLAALKEQQKREQERKATAQQKAAKAQAIRREFDVALATVNKQLLCRSTINMRDINVAVEKLRDLDKSRYTKIEPKLVKDLSSCIVKIGSSFPERGEEFKKRAMRLFPGNVAISSIKIEPKDPCDKSLAGLGARGERAICRDPLKSEGEYFGKGPALVVIPGKGSLSSFAIGKYELTIDDINKFCENSSACDEFSGSQMKMPITNVNLKLVQKYMRWLSEKSKRRYRLPTKVEWVYAARANSAKLDSNRNCELNSRGIQKGGVLLKATTGQQNPWGLVNHVGNARELVLDGGGYSALGGSFKTAMERCIVTLAEDHSGSADQFTGYRLLREIDKKR